MNTSPATTSHTPGPWTVKPGCIPDYYSVDGPEGASQMVCSLSLTDSGGDLKANAHLVAAAPELLAALQRALYEVSKRPANTWFDPFIRTAMEDAIAKATT